jgi:predicted phosphodiesterase
MTNGLVLCVPDVHVPYHHKRAWELMLEVIDHVNPALTIQLGDFGDNKAFSRHGRSFGEKHDPERDMAVVKREAGRIQSAARRRFKMLRGNHDAWITRHAAENAPALEIVLPSYAEMYGLDEEPEPYQDIFKIGKVGYVHDLGFAGKNALHSTLATAGGNIVFGHTHRGGTVYSGTVEGERWFAMSCGWLGDEREIKYMNRAAMRDWQLGFGTVEYSEGLAFAQFHPIVKGRVRVRGKTYRW